MISTARNIYKDADYSLVATMACNCENRLKRHYELLYCDGWRFPYRVDTTLDSDDVRDAIDKFRARQSQEFLFIFGFDVMQLETIGYNPNLWLNYISKRVG